ncbi:MAG: hypothetical protein GXO32_06095 [Crenarchaeota archaeon]|nr:hypothetical protein [Thermoproteota archaeon]
MSSNDGKSLTRRVIEFLESYPGARPSDIANALGVSRLAIYRVLAYLKSRGIVKKVGGGYVLARPLPRNASHVENSVESIGKERQANALEEIKEEVSKLKEDLKRLSESLTKILEALSLLSARDTRSSSADAILRFLRDVKICDVDSLALLLKLAGSRDMCSKFVVLGYLAVRRDFLEEIRAGAYSSELERILVRGYEMGSYEDLCIYL